MSKLNRNFSPLKQPSGTSRFQLNTVTSPEHIGSECNEPGNELCVTFDSPLAGQPIILDRDRQVVCLTDNSVWIVNTTNCTKELHCQLDCFGWDTLNIERYPITGSYRQVRGCEDIIYLHDHVNPDRFINLTRPETQKTDGEFDCSKFNFNAEIVHSTITTDILEFGGALGYGTYNFAVEYLTENQDSLFVTPVDIGYTPIIYQNKEGGLNISANLADIGGKPLSPKSIKIKVDNIPEDAILARIIVFRSITGDGITSDAHVIGSLIQLSGTSFEFVYTGFNTDNGDYLIDKNQYLVPKAIYETSLDGVQVNNRYLRYNLKETVRDYSNYQEVSSNIKAKYVINNIDKDDPDIHLLNRTFLGGEIILPCINYVHTDGTVSNSFPLINRDKNDNDVILIENTAETFQVKLTISNLTITSNTVTFDYEFSELLPNTSIILNYSSQQTATIPVTTISGNIQQTFNGNLGFTPFISVSNDYGTFDFQAIQEGTVSLYINNTQTEKWRLLDTSLKDPTPDAGYDSSGLFGYYELPFTYENPPKYCGEDYWGNNWQGTSILGEKVRLFVVPDRSFEPQETDLTIRPIGIKFENVTYPNNDVVGHYFSTVILNSSNVVAKGLGINSLLSSDPDLPNIRALFGFYFDDAFTTGNNTNTPDYKLITSEHMMLDGYVTGSYATQLGQWDYTYNNVNTDYDNIFHGDLSYDDLRLYIATTQATQYNSVTEENKAQLTSLNVSPNSSVNNIVNYSNTNTVNYYQINTSYTDPSPLKYLSVKRYTIPFNDLWNFNSRRITNLNQNVSFAGDSFISPLKIDNIWGVEGVGVGIPIFTSTRIIAYGEVLKDFYIESRVNMYVRHEGSDNCNKTIQHIGQYANFFINKITEPYIDKLKVRDSICPFFSGYNKDYSVVSKYNRYSPLTLTYDFCSKCTGLYPHRIIYSPQSFPEDQSDAYRINLANSYIDIPSHLGEITKVDYKDNKLVVRTQRGCFFITPNPQQLELNETTAYIGTGDFLSLPPQELNVTPIGYGGQQHKLDSLNFEKGLVWADRQRGEIYQLSGQFKELHSDLEEWISNNFDTSTHLAFGYDPYHDRLLMTQRNGWTLSYCFKEDGWKSWHSYIPELFTYDPSTVYSVYDNTIWKHLQKSNFCNFYDLQFPHIVEMIVIRDGVTFKPQSVHWHSNTYNLTNGYEEEIDTVTYDQMLCYNDRQSSGYQNLILDSEENIYYSPTITHVKKTDRNYKASPIKDLALSSNIWNTDISPIKQGNNQGFLLLLPLIDENRPEVETGEFRNKWYAVQLVFNNKDYKISLEFLTSQDLNSKR